MPHATRVTAAGRNIVGIHEETVTNTTSHEIPGHYPGEDHSWNIGQLKQRVQVRFYRNEPHDAVFSLIGVDPSIANAIRRILIAETATLAIEKVYIRNNTSVIQDELIAHRLGLIPLTGDKDGLRWMRWKKKPTEDDPTIGPSTDANTVVLSLDVECRWKPDGQKKLANGITDPTQLYTDAHVYAHQLLFEPTGQHEKRFPTGIKSVHPDILIAKLRPGQVIKLTAHAELGIGADHAKYSPVATASYRLLPVIDIREPIIGDDAVKFQKCFPEGVIKLGRISETEASIGGPLKGQEGQYKAMVDDPRRDTVTRECLRHDEFKNKVKLGRQRDHFIFSVESTCQWDADQMVLDAVALLRRKCARVARDFARVREQA